MLYAFVFKHPITGKIWQGEWHEPKYMKRMLQIHRSKRSGVQVQYMIKCIPKAD